MSKQTPDQLATYLATHGSSLASLRRQIEGEIAWRRLQQRQDRKRVSVGDDEVKAVLDKLNASKGTEEYRVGEIFLASTPVHAGSRRSQNANKILEQLKAGASFAAYARQYSEASTAAVGGDLGWVRPEQLPAPLAAVAPRRCGPGTISNPIPVPGGVSIIAVQDTRKILTADPRDAVLSLKQISINFPKGTTREQAEPIVARFAEAAKSIGGCGGADKIAADFHAEVVQSDGVKMRDLPATLQQIMLPMQVGQATPPFGSHRGRRPRARDLRPRRGAVRTGRTYDDVYSQLNEERVEQPRAAIPCRPSPRRGDRIPLIGDFGKAAGMSSAAPKPLAVSLGDPAGIGPEVIAKCWDNRATSSGCRRSSLSVTGARSPRSGTARSRSSMTRGRPIAHSMSHCRSSS